MRERRSLVCSATILLLLTIPRAQGEPANSTSPAAASSSNPDTAKAHERVKLVEVVGQDLTIATSTDAREAPTTAGSETMHIRSGAQVHVVGIVEGKAWLQIELPDKTLVYIPISAIPSLTRAEDYQGSQNAIGQPQPAPSQQPQPLGPKQSNTPSSREGVAQIPAESANMDFVSADDQRRVIEPTPVFVAPNTLAPQKYKVEPGTLVEVIASSRDGLWAWVRTQDDSPAFIPSAKLVVDNTGPSAEVMTSQVKGDADAQTEASTSTPEQISGKANVMSTSTLIVDGRKLSLFGVRGEGGNYARQLQKLIDSKGGIVNCSLVGYAYVCKLPDGTDVARVALFNGAAHLSADASADYRQQSAAAKSARRGVWQ